MINRIEKIQEEVVALIKEARSIIKEEAEDQIKAVQGTDVGLAEDSFADAVAYFKRAFDYDLLSHLR
jgi:hypothetical protein